MEKVNDILNYEYRGFVFLGTKIWTEKSKNGNAKVYRQSTYLHPNKRRVSWFVDKDYKHLVNINRHGVGVSCENFEINLSSNFIKNETIISRKAKKDFIKIVDRKYTFAHSRYMEDLKNNLESNTQKTKEFEPDIYFECKEKEIAHKTKLKALPFYKIYEYKDKLYVGSRVQLQEDYVYTGYYEGYDKNENRVGFSGWKYEKDILLKIINYLNILENQTIYEKEIKSKLNRFEDQISDDYLLDFL